MRKNDIRIEEIKYIESELGSFCSKMERLTNDYLGYVRVNDDCIDTNISIKDINSRHYMSLKYHFGFFEESPGIYRVVCEITPLGVLMRDADRFHPLETRSKRCQVDPCLFSLNKFRRNLIYNHFGFGPGHAYAMNEYKKLKEKLMSSVNSKHNKPVLYFKNMTLSGNDLEINPETTIEYYKKGCYGVDGKLCSEKGLIRQAEYAKKMSGLKNFSIKMPTPNVPLPLVDRKNIALKYENDALKANTKDKKETNKKEDKVVKINQSHYKRKSPSLFSSIHSFFTRLKESKKDKDTENKLSGLFSSNNIISVFLLFIPPLIYILDIILLAVLKENYLVKIDGNWLWFNYAFSYQLCDIIIGAMEGADFFMMLLYIILIILSGILETVLSLLHLLLFVVTIIFGVIYAFIFQNAIGAIISAIGLPIIALILNKMSGHQIKTPIIMLIVNIILVGVYAAIAFTTIGI